MSKLSAFLHPVEVSEEKEVIISDRFRDEKNAPLPFKIRALRQEENDEITKRATCSRKVNGQVQEIFDQVDYARRLAVEATIEPNFKSKEACEHFGVADPLLVPGKMLLAGEYSRLMRDISTLCGFNSDPLEEEVKN